MRIIKKRETHTSTHYQLGYEYEDMPGAGFAFDCDENGMIDEPTLYAEKPIAYQSLLACSSGVVNGRKVVLTGVRKWEHTYTEPAIGECECGAEVYLHSFTNTCDECERDYNMGGQLLCVREYWSEDTGEHLSDILRIR